MLCVKIIPHKTDWWHFINSRGSWINEIYVLYKARYSWAMLLINNKIQNEEICKH